LAARRQRGRSRRARSSQRCRWLGSSAAGVWAMTLTCLLPCRAFCSEVLFGVPIAGPRRSPGSDLRGMAPRFATFADSLRLALTYRSRTVVSSGAGPDPPGESATSALQHQTGKLLSVIAVAGLVRPPLRKCSCRVLVAGAPIPEQGGHVDSVLVARRHHRARHTCGEPQHAGVAR
jgi:hypothetical protein